MSYFHIGWLQDVHLSCGEKAMGEIELGEVFFLINSNFIFISKRGRRRQDGLYLHFLKFNSIFIVLAAISQIDFVWSEEHFHCPRFFVFDRTMRQGMTVSERRKKLLVICQRVKSTQLESRVKSFFSRELFGRRCIFSNRVQPLSSLFSPSNTRHPFHFLAFRYRKHNWIKLPFRTWTLMPTGVAFDGEQTYFPLSFDFARWIKRYEVVTSPFSVITLTPPRGES